MHGSRINEYFEKSKYLFLSFFLIFFCQSGYGLCHPESLQLKKNQETLQHEVVVVLKLVQVYVTDKDGNPVKDLEKPDFVIYDNGKLQTITDFEKHFLVKPEKKAKEEITKTELSPPKDISSRMNRKFSLILDMDRNSIAGINKSKKAALHFIDTQLQLTDEVGILSYSFIRRLVVHQYLSSDHEKVKEVIRKIKEVPGMLLPGNIWVGDEALGEQPDIVGRTNIFIKIIKELAKALRYIPGYKNIILFSAGLREDLLISPDQVLRENYEDMSKEFGASNSPVYTVNTSDVARSLSLKMLSELSGGKYFHNVDYYERITEQIQSVTCNYYVLGYYIDEKWDGRYHEIKVKIKRSECIVHAQGGYFNPKPFSEFSETEKQLQLMALALSENPYFEQPLRFPMVALPFSNKKESNCVLLSEIPVEKIKDIAWQKTEIITLIFDKENNVIDSSRGEMSLAAFSQKKIYHYEIQSLAPGQYECRVVIRNLETGKGAVASSSLTIPEIQASGISLSPPFILIPDKVSFYLRTSKPEKEKPGDEPLSLIKIYPFLSNKHSPLIEELEEGTPKLLAIIPCAVANIEEPDIQLSSCLIPHSTGEKIPLSFSIISAEKEKEFDILLIELELPELRPGKYSLEIGAEEVTSGSKSNAIRTFKVSQKD